MSLSKARETSSYAPRNALNADQLKSEIEARSNARGDDDAVRAWLLNHFYRHLIANFEPARRIGSLDDARRALDSDTLPDWVVARFGSSAKVSGDAAITSLAPVVWVDPAEPKVQALEAQLVEFLQSREGTPLAGKFNRINCPQALALWEKEHAEMAAKISRGWRESQPDALRTMLSTPGGNVVEFLPDSVSLRAEMAFESYVMRHCLGQFSDRHALTGGYGGRYAEAIEQRRLRLLSFRDANRQPHITVSVTVQADGALSVEQVKGKQNRPPAQHYVDSVLACLNALETDDTTPPDCVAIGIVRTSAGWQRIGDVTDAATQARLIARYPQLFARLVSPAPMVEWIVAARQPGLLTQHPPQAASVNYATRALQRSSAMPEAQPGPATCATEGVSWPGLSASQAAAVTAARVAARRNR